jgi:hypothetical protein
VELLVKWEYTKNALIFTTSESYTVTFKFDGEDPLCLGTLELFARHVRNLEQHVLECESMLSVRGIAAPDTPLREWINSRFVDAIKGE